MLRVAAVIVLCVASVARSTTESPPEVASDEQPEASTRRTNWKTYFFQLRKDDGNEMVYKHVRKDEEVNAPYGNEEPEFIVDDRDRTKTRHGAFESLKNRRRGYMKAERTRSTIGMNFLDDEWHYSVHNKHLVVPEITTELFRSIEDESPALQNVSVIRFLFESRARAENVLKFNLDCLVNKTGEAILDAELHIYRSAENNETDDGKYSSDQVIRLYQILPVNETENDTTQNPDVHKLLNVIYVSSQYSGWQVFKVKNVLDNWLQGDDNLGFLLSVTDSWENLKPLDIGRKFDGVHQPVLIIYINKGTRKDVTSAVIKPDPRRMEKYMSTLKNNFLPHNPAPCGRHVWYVSFQELGWNNFIIAPSGFMAFRCKGSCSSKFISPFTYHGLLTNAYQANVSNLKMACCVPDLYSDLPIMFFDRYLNIVIKIYRDMIVDTCACR